MRVVGSEPDLLDHFDLVVDPDASETDVEEALAEFFLSYARRKLSATDDHVPASAVVSKNTGRQKG